MSAAGSSSRRNSARRPRRDSHRGWLEVKSERRGVSAVRADRWCRYYAVYNEMNMYELRLFRTRDDASLPLTEQQDRVAHMFIVRSVQRVPPRCLKRQCRFDAFVEHVVEDGGIPEVREGDSSDTNRRWRCLSVPEPHLVPGGDVGTDADGAALPCYGLAQSVPFWSNAVAATMRWSGEGGAACESARQGTIAAGQQLQVRFVIEDCDLFSMRLV